MLTLIVVPVVYTILDDIRGWLLGRRKAAAAVVTSVTILAVAIGAATPASAQATDEAASALGLAAAAARLASRSPHGLVVGESGGQAAEPPPAEPAPAGLKVLTLEQALAIAADQNRDVQKAVEYQKWVQGKYLEERAAALPQGSFGVNALRQFDDSQSKLFRNFMPADTGATDSGLGDIFGGRQDVRTAQFTVNQVVFTWGQVGAAIRAAKLGHDVADQQLRRFQQAVAKDVTTTFYDVLVGRELLKIAQEDLAQKQRHLEETKRRAAAGTATDYDVLAAQVAVENARPTVIRAENAVRVTRQQLRFLLAEPGEVDVAGTLETAVEAPPAYDEVLSQALANRPELGEMKSTRAIYGELVTIARAASKPRLDFSASWGKRSLGLRTLSSTGTNWTAGLFATVPIFDGWRTKGLVAQAESDAERIGLDELKLRDSIGLEVRTAIDNVREASEIVAAMTGTVTQAERLLFLAEKGFELGVKTRLEVQDAELNLSSARVNLARAERDYRVARVNLQWVSGTLATP